MITRVLHFESQLSKGCIPMSEPTELQVLMAAVEKRGGWGEAMGSTVQVSIRMPIHTLVRVEALAQLAEYQRSKMIIHLLDTATEIVNEQMTLETAERFEQLQSDIMQKLLQEANK